MSLGNVATSTWDGTQSDVVYHLHDHLGGTHVEVDDTGSVVEYVLYTPFGSTLTDVQSGGYANDKKYTGKELDSETDWYYYGARYYNPRIGRFLSEDPVFVEFGISDFSLLNDPQSLNSYSYGRNSPIRFNDPDGRFWNDVLNSLAGALNAWGTNMIGGIGRQEPHNTSFAVGQSIGDAASIVQGAYESALGFTIGTGGVAVSSTGVGAIIGAPAAAVGTAFVAHGGVTAAAGIYNLSQGSGGGFGNGGNGTSVADTIANGHAYDKHVIKRGEFGEMSRKEFSAHISDVMNNPTATRDLRYGRTGYWQESSGTVVIKNPLSPDGGTAYRPKDGASYFYEKLK